MVRHPIGVGLALGILVFGPGCPDSGDDDTAGDDDTGGRDRHGDTSIQAGCQCRANGATTPLGHPASPLALLLALAGFALARNGRRARRG